MQHVKAGAQLRIRHRPVAALARELVELEVGDSHVALPRGVGRVGLGQPLPNAERLAEEALGLGQTPLGRRQIAEPFERHRQIALPRGAVE